MSEQDSQAVDQAQNQAEPVDIASAFKLYNQQQREAAQPPVEAGEEPAGEPGEPADTGVGEEAGVEEQPEEAADDLGGSPAVIEPVDYSPAREALLKDIQQSAINQVRAEMQEQQIELWSMNDIYERDEQTGRVTFNNPDDPQHPFSGRAEAQNWINAMNQDINNHFRMRVNQKQQELIQSAAPTLQVIDFAERYNGMDDITKQVFDTLIEPYAIKNNTGNVIGFNTNLESAYNIAQRIVGNMPKAQQLAEIVGSMPKAQQLTEQAKGEPKEKSGSRPATDIKGGNGEDPDAREPKTIGEALKMWDKMNRKDK